MILFGYFGDSKSFPIWAELLEILLFISSSGFIASTSGVFSCFVRRAISFCEFFFSSPHCMIQFICSSLLKFSCFFETSLFSFSM
jgi:hypothetical protein